MDGSVKYIGRSLRRRDSSSGEEEFVPSNEEVGKSVDYLIAHRLEVARSLLSEADSPTCGNKSELRKRILTALADDRLSPLDVIQRLDEVEGWGNQHIVLYHSTEPLAAKWQDANQVRKKLRSAGLDNLLNHSRPIALPDKPTLSQIMWTAVSLRLI